MKKWYFVFLLIFSILILTSCDKEQEVQDEHSHDFSSEWLYDSINHYHICEDEECGEVTDKSEHTFTEWSVIDEAGCDTSGVKERKCSVCEYSEQANIPALGHDFTQWEVKTPATVESDEVQHRICNSCSLEETKVMENTKLIFYEVKFVDADGTVLETLSVKAGNVPEFTLELPTKDADMTYTYQFAGWDKELVAANENAVYTATYTKTYIEYTVIFKDINGFEISRKENYHYGDNVVVPEVSVVITSDKLYSFDHWDNEVTTVTGDATYQAVYDEVALIDNGSLTWTENVVRDSVKAMDFYDGTHHANVSVVEIDGKNALQIKYEEGFFSLDGTVKTTPGIQFVNSNKFNLTENSVVTFSVRVNDEWSVSHDRAGIYIFYDGVVCGNISASGKLWNSATAPKVKDNVFINKSEISVTQVFANATISDKNWVNVTISFNGIENPDLSKLSIAYGVAQGKDYNGLLNTQGDAGHCNSWIYISDLTVETHNISHEMSYDETHHWYACNDEGCNKVINYETHKFTDWVTETPSTDDTDEIQSRSCTVCGKEETKTIVTQTFEVKFVDYDGTVLETLTVYRGSIPEFTQDLPAREADDNYIYLFSGWDSEVVAAREDVTYTAVYKEVAKVENGQLVWDEENVNYSVTSKDFYANLYPADLSVVEIDGRNALQVKYAEAFFETAGTNRTTPAIQFINNNKFNLTENSVVTFSVRVSDEWNFANDQGGIYIFYDGVACGIITTSGKLWDGATATGPRDRYIYKTLVSTTNIFANGTIGDKNWVDVTISFEGIENPDLSKLTIAYGNQRGQASGLEFHGLLSTEANHKNTSIYISDLNVMNASKGIVWNESNINTFVDGTDFYAGLYSPDLSVVEVDGKNALQVKYADGFFELPEQNKTTPGIKFIDGNYELTENSVVTFSVRVSDEWNYSNNGAGIYILYNGEVCGTITTSGKLWDGATATGTRDRYFNKTIVPVTNVFANGTIGDKNWVDVTITFEGIENPDLANLTIAYGCLHGSNYSGLLSTETEQRNSWIYISDITIVTEE